MKERFRFVRDAPQRFVSFTELCALDGVRRSVGYKWLHRVEHSGRVFLQELSRRPHSYPHAMSPEGHGAAARGLGGADAADVTKTRRLRCGVARSAVRVA